MANHDEPNAQACGPPTHAAENAAPVKGEVWKWHWLWVTVTSAGPKRVTWRSADGEIGSTPTDRFLLRFHRTGVTSPGRTA